MEMAAPEDEDSFDFARRSRRYSGVGNPALRRDIRIKMKTARHFCRAAFPLRPARPFENEPALPVRDAVSPSRTTTRTYRVYGVFGAALHGLVDYVKTVMKSGARSPLYRKEIH